MSLNNFEHVCEQNYNAKRAATPFSIAWGGGGERRHCGANWPAEVVEKTAFHEFDENYIFFTSPVTIYIGHTLRIFNTFHLKKDAKDGSREKCLK